MKKILIVIGVALVVGLVILVLVSTGTPDSSNPTDPQAGVTLTERNDFVAGIGLGPKNTKLNAGKITIPQGAQSGSFRNTSGRDMLIPLPTVLIDTIGVATTSNSWEFQAATSSLSSLFNATSATAGVGTTTNAQTGVVIDNVKVLPNNRLVSSGLSATTTAKVASAFVLKDGEYFLFGMFGTSTCAVTTCEQSTSTRRGTSTFIPELNFIYYQR